MNNDNNNEINNEEINEINKEENNKKIKEDGIKEDKLKNNSFEKIFEKITYSKFDNIYSNFSKYNIKNILFYSGLISSLGYLGYKYYKK